MGPYIHIWKTNSKYLGTRATKKIYRSMVNWPFNVDSFNIEFQNGQSRK